MYQHSAIVLVNQDIVSLLLITCQRVCVCMNKGYYKQVHVKLLVCKVWLSKGGHAIIIFLNSGGGGGGGGGGEGRSNPAWKPNL